MAIIDGTILAPNGHQARYFRFASPREWFDYILSAHPTAFLPDDAENIKRGYSLAASAEFGAARTSIQRPMIRGPVQAPAVCGGAWIIPSVLANHPMPARQRTASKLPPLRVKVRLNSPDKFSSEEINRAAAKLARGLWEYKLAGGIVELSLWYFSSAGGGGKGFLRVDVDVPITNEAQLAYALSAYSYREAYISHGTRIMGGLGQVPTAMDPGVLWLVPPAVDQRLAEFGLLHEGEK